MNRREFLQTLGLTAAVVSFAPSALADAATATPDAGLDEILHVGDVFTIEGRYAINPITMKTTDILQQFIVTTVTPDRADLRFHPTLKTSSGPDWAMIHRHERFSPPPSVTRTRRR